MAVAKQRAVCSRNTKPHSRRPLPFFNGPRGCHAGSSGGSGGLAVPDVFYQGLNGRRTTGIRRVFRHPEPSERCEWPMIPLAQRQGVADRHWWISSKCLAFILFQHDRRPEIWEADDEKGKMAGNVRTILAFGRPPTHRAGREGGCLGSWGMM